MLLRPDGMVEIGRMADRAQQLLRSAGLSTPELDDLLSYGRAAGALGGKLSGAGGGGAFYLIYESGEKAKVGARLLGERARRTSGQGRAQAFCWNGSITTACS